MAFADPQKNLDRFGVTPGAQVADLGAGAGFYTIAAAKKTGPDGRVFAIDVLPDMLSLVQKKAREERLTNIAVIRGDLERIGGSTLRDASVDSVVISNILFQIHHKEAFLKEAFRILKPGGRALVIEWKESFGGMGPPSGQVYPEALARRTAENVGFEIAEPIRAGDHHYGIILRKPR